MSYPAGGGQQAPVPGDQDRRRRFNPRGYIVKVEPHLAEENLFKQIVQQILDIGKPVKEEELERIPNTVASLLQVITKHYLGTALGGQIMDPRRSRDIVIDRIIQFTEMLLSVQNEYINRMIEEIDSNIIKSEKDVEEKIRRILQNYDIIFIVVRELMNRLYILLQINAPAGERPSLANVKMGFDIIK